jgi:hypothetical protein
MMIKDHQNNKKTKKNIVNIPIKNSTSTIKYLSINVSLFNQFFQMLK